MPNWSTNSFFKVRSLISPAMEIKILGISFNSIRFKRSSIFSRSNTSIILIYCSDKIKYLVNLQKKLVLNKEYKKVVFILDLLLLVFFSHFQWIQLVHKHLYFLHQSLRHHHQCHRSYLHHQLHRSPMMMMMTMMTRNRMTKHL